ncbi:DUF6036 family nucleotidyltransferase [Sulfobacillus sp. hq2]|uniref:DUF6036 family nucleotidyltransferase n=1 Tax=Sulfobacillus TaxID=28033 RepID=UPI000CD0D4E9|nr:DUF6036 family nucleotidyltransferase [Sulfobacillus sp. hq2]POB12342.1 hypothetical protein CO251_00015 [Sulfobacillus sp. hq2]
MGNFNLRDDSAVYRALQQWDESAQWPRDGHAVLVLLGGVALAFYHVMARDTTHDIDAILLESTVVPDRLIQEADNLDISFRAGSVAWLQQDWESRIHWSSWQFRHLTVGWLSPYDWIVSKLGRWQQHDSADAIAVAQNLNPNQLYEYVKDGLNDYIGNPANPRSAWNDLVDALRWPSTLKL